MIFSKFGIGIGPGIGSYRTTYLLSQDIERSTYDISYQCVQYHSLATGTGFSVDVGTAVIEHSVKVSEPALHRKIYRYRYSIIIVSVYRYHNFWRNFSRPSGRFSTNHSVEFKCLQVYWHLYNRFIKRNKPRKNLLNSEVFSFKLGFILRIWRASNNLDNSLVTQKNNRVMMTR